MKNKDVWSLDEYREYIRTGVEPESGTADTNADLEPTAGVRPLAEKKDPRFDTPVRIHVRSFRHRLADADGISAKAAIDGLVHRRILVDDKTQFVEEVSYSQVKVPQAEEERTEIMIYEKKSNYNAVAGKNEEFYEKYFH